MLPPLVGRVGEQNGWNRERRAGNSLERRGRLTEEMRQRRHVEQHHDRQQADGDATQQCRRVARKDAPNGAGGAPACERCRRLPEHDGHEGGPRRHGEDRWRSAPFGRNPAMANIAMNTAISTTDSVRPRTQNARNKSPASTSRLPC